MIDKKQIIHDLSIQAMSYSIKHGYDNGKPNKPFDVNVENNVYDVAERFYSEYERFFKVFSEQFKDSIDSLLDE